MSTEQENRDNILKPYIRLEPGRHSPVNVDLANSFWERTANKFLAVLGLIDTKVRMEDGKGLSDQNFTLEEKEKLAGLESSHYRGTYDSLSSLQSSVLNPVAGDYADVDGGQGHITSRYLWDPTDNHWEQMIGESTQLTGSQVKVMYESQPDTNVFDDNAKNKLTGISSGATKNQTDSYLLDRANHTGTQPVSTITGLGAAATANVVQTTGSSTTNVMSQKAVTDALDTKASTSHTHPWVQVTGQPATATRWPTFDEVTGKPSTYAPSGHTHPHTQVTGLGTAATRNVGTASDQIPLNSALSSYLLKNAPNPNSYIALGPGHSIAGDVNNSVELATTTEVGGGGNSDHTGVRLVAFGMAGWGTVKFGVQTSTNWKQYGPVSEILHTGNILATTGQSNQYPMSQKAVTDAINAATENIDVSGPRPVKDHGAVASAGSQTVVCNVQESDFHMLDMSGANATGTLTIDFANMPNTVGKHFSWHVRLRRGGRKTVAFAQSISWAGGVAPGFGTIASSYDLIMFYKVGSETIRGMVIDAW